MARRHRFYFIFLRAVRRPKKRFGRRRFSIASDDVLCVVCSLYAMHIAHVTDLLERLPLFFFGCFLIRSRFFVLHAA